MTATLHVAEKILEGETLLLCWNRVGYLVGGQEMEVEEADDVQ